MIASPFKQLKRLRQRQQLRIRDERQTHKDRALAYRLYNTFEHELELADVQGFQFYVQNGTVTLFGVVRHELDRDMMVSIVRQVPGVKGVIGRLQIVDQRFQEATPVAA